MSEAGARALGFLAVLSSSLIALGFIGQMSLLGTAFYAFALVLLPAVAVIGLITFERLVQLTNEDIAFARRIARVREFYVDSAPEVAPYLTVVRASGDRTEPRGRQLLLTTAGMVAVVNSGIVGTAVGILVAAATAGDLGAALAAGVPTGVAALLLHLGRQRRSRVRAGSETIDALAVVATGY